MKKEKHEEKGNEQKSNEIKIERETKKEIAEETNNEQIEKYAEELSKAKIKTEQLEKDIEAYKDKLLRKAAEFENYKRRTENDQLNLIKYAAEPFILKLLSVVDDFERSLQHIENAKDVDSLKEGIKLVYEKMMKLLNEQGVTKIESVGKPFDVQYHEALMQRPADNVSPHTVLDEIEKGYMYKDRVLRHAKVVVSEDNDTETLNTTDSEDDTQKNSEDK